MAKKKNDLPGVIDPDTVMLGDPNMPDPDMSDDELGVHKDRDEDKSEHKEYMVHRDGTVINGELLNQGDCVTLHPDVAKAHTDADVRLTEVKQSA